MSTTKFFAQMVTGSRIRRQRRLLIIRCCVSSVYLSRQMYIPQPVKINLKDGVVETAGGIRKITVVFMELLDLEIAVSDDKDTLSQVRCGTAQFRTV